MPAARPEPPITAAQVFSGATLDRAAELRSDPARVGELLAEPDAAVLAATADGVLLDRRAGALLRAPIDGDPAALIDPAAPILLGLDRGAPLFAADLERLPAYVHSSLTAHGDLVTLREAGAALPQAEGGLAAYLVALLNWHRRHRFCANCGAETQIAEAGLSRSCPSCGASHFPRTDPVVIMLVEHDGQLLLGRRSGWPQNRFSILAGFVSAGETPEEAVIREVREESGIEAYAPRYVASQPWPFPSSLMLGFDARSDGGTPRTGDGELAEVAWFTAAQILDAQREREQSDLGLPPPVSIARTLIDGWIARQRSSK